MHHFFLKKEKFRDFLVFQETDAFQKGRQLLTHCILVDSSTVICWTSPVVILGVLGLFCRFD